MEQISRTIKLHYTDREINKLLSNLSGDYSPFSRHYNQSEEFFLKLKAPFIVPSLPIHHDINNLYPDKNYMENIKKVVKQITSLAPSVLFDLTYMFDPTEILKPTFFKIYRINEHHYLYLLKIDLGFKASYCEVIERGSNDFIPEYKTSHLFLEANLIPLSGIELEGDKIRGFKIRQTISQTWIGERGRGYFVQGIWIDDDLTKFFSKLFLPPGKRTYPFYPFVCKYKTICLNIIDFSPESRKKQLPYLHHAISFLLPEIDKIQNALKNTDFSENLEIFKQLKTKVPEALSVPWKNIKVEMYLNEQDMKEFLVEL